MGGGDSSGGLTLFRGKRVDRSGCSILQARTGSSRLPGKVLADLAGRPMLAFLVERLRRCNSVDRFILATTDLAEDDVLAELGNSLGLTVVCGSQQDVLSRYALAAQQTDAPVLVRITGDCPFVDPGLLEEMIHEFLGQEIDYFSNCTSPTILMDWMSKFSPSCFTLAHAECDPAQRA